MHSVDKCCYSLGRKFGTNLEAENIYIVLLSIASICLIDIGRAYECFIASDSWSVDTSYMEGGWAVQVAGVV